MGRYQAVAETLGIRWRGFPAWFLARTYHLLLMPGTKRKYRLLVDWNVDLFFGRDTSELGQLGHPARSTVTPRAAGSPATAPAAPTQLVRRHESSSEETSWPCSERVDHEVRRETDARMGDVAAAAEEEDVARPDVGEVQPRPLGRLPGHRVGRAPVDPRPAARPESFKTRHTKPELS